MKKLSLLAVATCSLILFLIPITATPMENETSSSDEELTFNKAALKKSDSNPTHSTTHSSCMHLHSMSAPNIGISTTVLVVPPPALTEEEKLPHLAATTATNCLAPGNMSLKRKSVSEGQLSRPPLGGKKNKPPKERIRLNLSLPIDFQLPFKMSSLSPRKHRRSHSHNDSQHFISAPNISHESGDDLYCKAIDEVDKCLSFFQSRPDMRLPTESKQDGS